ncbi:hypothetical protein BDP27DRAFT_1368701 [Rhodocollybia butyracea]|uniref:Uncharacterized protein n=1 Tax=Rhodocollybia butyracea TaxID=206335 RepID=A0A9P5PIG0_9AGAR|nr:hypothetical protein BDP27DRAFT_1368701 [Rhodocollybia butyracea]
MRLRSRELSNPLREGERWGHVKEELSRKQMLVVESSNVGAERIGTREGSGSSRLILNMFINIPMCIGNKCIAGSFVRSVKSCQWEGKSNLKRVPMSVFELRFGKEYSGSREDEGRGRNRKAGLRKVNFLHLPLLIVPLHLLSPFLSSAAQNTRAKPIPISGLGDIQTHKRRSVNKQGRRTSFDVCPARFASWIGMMFKTGSRSTSAVTEMHYKPGLELRSVKRRDSSSWFSIPVVRRVSRTRQFEGRGRGRERERTSNLDAIDDVGRATCRMQPFRAIILGTDVIIPTSVYVPKLDDNTPQATAEYSVERMITGSSRWLSESEACPMCI